MSTTLTRQGTVGVLKAPEAWTASNAEQVREQAYAWLEANADVTHLVADLSDMDTLDSSGLGVMIALLKRMGERGGDLKLAGLRKKPRMVIEITRAYRVFEIFETLGEALDAGA